MGNTDVPLKGCARTFKVEGFDAAAAVAGAASDVEAVGKAVDVVLGAAVDDFATVVATAAADVTAAVGFAAAVAVAANDTAAVANDGFLAVAEFCRDNEGAAIGTGSNAIFTCSASTSMGASDETSASDTKSDSRAAVSN